MDARVVGLLLSLGVAAVVAEGCAGHEHPASGRAELILYGGVIWTGGPKADTVEALAVRGGRILALGSNTEILALQGPQTRTLDLKGRLAIPGFHDAHVHLLDGGDELLAPDLRSARSVEEFARRLGEAAARLPPGAWLTSGSWDHQNWPGAPLPTRWDIDSQTPENPVFVPRLDGHMALANSLALRLAGITRDTPQPQGGEIVRDPQSGEPTGILKDAAMDLVRRRIPPWSQAELEARALAALGHAASLGITCLHDMGTSLEALALYRRLEAEGRLTARIRAYVPLSAVTGGRFRADPKSRRDSLLRAAGVKAFADGSLGSSTALFFDPYDDDPSRYGLRLEDTSPGGALERGIERALELGLQPAIHAIGDRANREVLDLYERLRQRRRDGMRYRIEHAQHLHPGDLGRFARLDVVASMQPYHLADDGRWAEARIGKRRSRSTYAFRSLLDRGAVLAFGSDWPVAPLSPFEGLYAAVTRRTLDGLRPGGWVPEEKISVEESLRAYTAGGAQALGEEGELGILGAGRPADLAVIDRNLLAVTPEEIRTARADITIVRGRIVYDRLGELGPTRPAGAPHRSPPE